ncbi:hypothetical protein GMI70_06865 [Eggerthellaceae bacterium zg-893]|nr:hypothetical protein [Eggerthellaceae bacterium zg-893]
MRRTFSASPLEPIAYYPQRDGKAKVWLRENIASTKDDEGETWEADEVSFETRLSLAQVEANFDDLWVQAETDAQPESVRIAELQEQITALTNVLLFDEGSAANE